MSLLARLLRVGVLVLPLLVAVPLAACGGGDDGPPGPQGPPGPSGPPGPGGGGSGSEIIGPIEPLPGVHIAITGLTGATGPNGTFQPGDVMTVLFTVTDDDGAPLDLAAFDFGEIYAAGPTFATIDPGTPTQNVVTYNPVFLARFDVVAASVDQGGGVWAYTLPPFPAVYPAPYNDTPSFGLADGELQGQPILPGTYTVAIDLMTEYAGLEGEVYEDAGAGLRDFLVGGATTLAPREVVGNDNCNACHVDLRFHGGLRQDVRTCVLCHTAGAEDRNNPLVEGGTPGVTIDFRVMIHKLHRGHNLPSVIGLTTNPDGTRNYAASSVPLKYVGFMDQVEDYSGVLFPVWPSLNIATLKDTGYSALPAPSRAKEDRTYVGAMACGKCHGDPDAGGPLQAPADGDRYETVPQREACGSCHDDINWAYPYLANGPGPMPANLTNSTCTLCHPASGGGISLSVREAHTHPLFQLADLPTSSPITDLSFDTIAFGEAPGFSNGDGTIDPGERIQVTFSITDQNGLFVNPNALGGTSLVISGPTSNYNVLLNGSVPRDWLAAQGAQPFTIVLPASYALEFVGTTNGGGVPQVLATGVAPHLATAQAPTTVRQVTAVGGGGRGDTTSTAAVTALQNFVDVASLTNFARNDYLVLEYGGAKEFQRIQWVDAARSRLWFYAPARLAHASGVAVQEVALATLAAPANYALNAATGQITIPAGGPGAPGVPVGDLVVDYWSHFVMPTVYPPPLNDGEDLDAEWGEWLGRPLVSGTYTMDLWGYVSQTVTWHFEANSYRVTSTGEAVDFLVGDATSVEPYEIISEASNCYGCHDDLWFHGGGRRGFVTCIVCHATAGCEDRPQYVAANAPATPFTSIAFRQMLHRIHRGADLAKADTYTVVGFGSAAYPNNFTAYQYDEVDFPAMPDGVRRCVKCHGNEAWQDPSDRRYPGTPSTAVRSWGFACGGCHDDDAAQAHMNAQYSPVFGEACDVCHGEGADFDVEKAHYDHD